MDRRLISKTISYLLLICLLLLSWGFYQLQLKQVAKEKESLQQTFNDQQQAINKLKSNISDLQYSSDYDKYTLNNQNCAVSSCTFSKKINLEMAKEMNNGFIMVNAFLQPAKTATASALNEKLIQVTTPVNLIPESMRVDQNKLLINTFYLSNQELSLISNSTQANNITIGIVILNQLSYAVFVKPL